MYSNCNSNTKPEQEISGSHDGFSYPFGRVGLVNPCDGFGLSSRKDCSVWISPKAVYEKSSNKFHTNYIESDMYCDLLPTAKNSQTDKCLIKNTNEKWLFEQQCLNQYSGLSDLRKNSGPPPMDLTYRNGNTHASDIKHTFQKYPDGRNKQYQAQYQSSLLQINTNYSSDEHYHRYCSYYYQRQPEICMKNRQTNRRIITKLMASAKNYVDETTDRTIKEQIKIKDHDNCNNMYSLPKYEDGIINAKHPEEFKTNVLTERIMNNNSIHNNYSEERKELLGDKEEFVTYKREISNIKNAPKFLSDNMDLCDVNVSKSSWKKKGNIYTKIPTTNSFEIDSNSWIDVTNNNDDLSSEQSSSLPKKNQCTAKKSPPSHRVLLYGNQSPRLNRLSLQEQKKMYTRSPEIKTKKTRNAEEKLDDVKCYASLNRPVPLVHFKDGSNIANYLNINKLDDDNDGDLSDDETIVDSCESDQSSDSEEGYRAYAYKLTHSVDNSDENQIYRMPDTSHENLKNPISLLVPSLFPNVPPYIAFSSNSKKGPDVSPELYRILKWRVTNVMPKVVRSVLTNSGMRLLKKTNDWMGTWGKHMKSPCFKTIRPYQKINHLPGSFKIGRKDSCWKNLQKQMCKYGKKDFGFMPKTYVIPHDLNSLRRNWSRYSQRNVKWIIKPPASARGTGIRVVDRWAQIPKRRPLIVQKYIERPLLINGSKFDLRLYVLVTSINPLRVYMYHNGLARFASVKYSDKSDTLNDRCMHLTNYSINKLSLNYSKNEDVNACHGHKWTIKSLWTYLANRGIRTDCLWEALRNLVLRTILAGENSINNMVKMNVESKYSCFELFGFDVLLDADLIPWLLEVNISPSLHSELPLDAHVKAPLVQGVLNTALYNVPPKLSLDKQKEISVSMSLPPGPICYDKRMYINYLSRAEKIKHNNFTRKSLEEREEYVNEILENLTPDDVRCLIVAEDELARSAPLERIFPTIKTHKYLKYTESPRYYNRLLDAWENRYGHNRIEGIALLRILCEDKYHLEIPPSPVKKHIKYRTQTIVKKRIPNLNVATVISIVPRWKRQHFTSRLKFHWCKQGEMEKPLLEETKYDDQETIII